MVKSSEAISQKNRSKAYRRETGFILLMLAIPFVNFLIFRLIYIINLLNNTKIKTPQVLTLWGLFYIIAKSISNTIGIDISESRCETSAMPAASDVSFP